MDRVSREELETCIRKWQDILRLRDWDIRLRIVRRKWRKFGDVKVDPEDKKAVLLINHRPYSRTDYNLEELVVHELLHLKFDPMDQMLVDLLNALYGEGGTDPKRQFAETQFMVMLETTVEDLTKSFLAASGSTRPLSFGRLQKKVTAALPATPKRSQTRDTGTAVTEQ